MYVLYGKRHSLTLSGAHKTLLDTALSRNRVCFARHLFDVHIALLVGRRGVRGPEREIVPEQLHDRRAVLVLLLVQAVHHRDRVIEGRLETLLWQDCEQSERSEWARDWRDNLSLDFAVPE